MTGRRCRAWTVGLAAAAGLAACVKRLPPDLAPEELFEAGRTAFADRKWLRAREAFERLLLVAPTHPKADSAQFLIAESYFEEKQYLTAATEFLKLAQTRPTIELADDARFRACRAYAELSPRPELDQKYTHEAIAECRALLLLYPESPWAEEARVQIAALRNKLARKMYLNAKYYMDRGAYDSAILYFNDLLKEYPDSPIVPSALLRLHDAYRKVGYEEEAREVRARLLREFPNSPEARALGATPAANGG